MKKLYNTFITNMRNNPEDIDSAKSLIGDVAKILKYSQNEKAAKAVRYFNNAVSIYSAGLVVTNTVNLARTLFSEEKPMYTIEIGEHDMLYNVVTSLLSGAKEVGHQPTIELRSQTIEAFDDSRRRLAVHKDNLIGGEVIRFESSKAFVYSVPNTNEARELKINNYTVTVIFKKPDMKAFTSGYTDTESISARGSRSSARNFMSKTAVLYCESENARQEVMLFLRNNLSVLGKRKVTLFIGRNWGSFSANSETPDRSISSVILKDGQLTSIIKELQMFIENEDKYNEMGVPYHHGILLSGPPGTGKSSTAKTVASFLGLDTYYIPLSSVKDNETFNELISEIKPRSVLLIEDIDTIKAAKDRDKKTRDGVTMDALLNVLDGVLSPHGVITIATSNHIEELDEAVIRPGRIDTVYKIDYLDQAQFEQICCQFIGIHQDDVPDITNIKISPAEVIGEIKKHITDKKAALDAVKLFVETKIMEKEFDGSR